MAQHILLSFALYALYVLLPIIPAVVIYRLFPKTTTDVSGPLGGLGIKAGGAFAAYIATVALGCVLVTNIDNRIEAMSTPVWNVSAKLVFWENDGRVIQDPYDIMKDLKVVVTPALEQVVYPQFSMRLPLLTPNDWPTLQFHAPGFRPHSIDLNEEEGAARDALKGSVALHKIVLKKLPPSVAQTPYTGAGEELKPIDGAPSEVQ